jgi:hypothetical protein
MLAVMLAMDLELEHEGISGDFIETDAAGSQT